MGLIQKLPVINKEQTGWPWTEETDPSIYDPSIHWPKISIVTPSYNQGQYIEETIRSILLQNYPNLEFMIIDGNSLDQTVDIIKKYDDFIDYWVSEKDNGQTDAINKGLALTTGELFNWVNSDDILLPGALFQIGKKFLDKGPDLIIGQARTVEMTKNNDRTVIRQWIPNININLITFIEKSMSGNGMSQTATFLRSQLLKDKKVKIRKDMHYCFDWALYFDLFSMKDSKIKISTISEPVAEMKSHEAAKTVSSWEKFEEEKYAFLKTKYPNVSFDIRTFLKKDFTVYKRKKLLGELKKQSYSLPGILTFLRKNPEMLLYRPFLGHLKQLIIPQKANAAH